MLSLIYLTERYIKRDKKIIINQNISLKTNIKILAKIDNKYLSSFDFRIFFFVRYIFKLIEIKLKLDKYSN